MRSCLYEGTIRHRRFRPVKNAFRYRLILPYVDLDEPDALFSLHPLWSARGPGLAWLRCRDHFGDPDLPLAEAVRRRVAEKKGRRPAGPVCLLCHPRYFGYVFNPASFYYCWDEEGSVLEAIVVEIHNTPWGEVHTYVLDRATNLHPHPAWRRHLLDKEFHVSPFIDMGIRYDWRFRVPGPALGVHMILLEGGERLFDATLALERRPVDREALGRVLWRYPLLTLKVTAMIYFQALRLALKGAPFYPHPRKRGRIPHGGAR